MRIAVTGASGFIGHYIVRRLVAQGHACRCWKRAGSDVGGFDASGTLVEWIDGQLGDGTAAQQLVAGCQAVIHAALDRPGTGFRGAEGAVVPFVETNLLGTLQLIEAARKANAERFIFLSTCAVHEKILDDRPLDEAHPLWPTTLYGAHKAAIEKFVHSYGLGEGYDICALRPSGVYGVHRPIELSKWYGLVKAVVRGEQVECTRGGKEVHAADVARAAELLLTAPDIAGQAFSCCDRYVSELQVAELARELTNSSAEIVGETKSPRHQIETGKIQALGMVFGGEPLLRETVGQLVRAIATTQATR